MKSSAIRQLDSMSGERRQFGRVPQQSVRKSSLPTNLVFWNEDTGMTYSLNTNGIVKFLTDSSIPANQENINWCADILLSTPITEAVNIDGNTVGISCEMDYDPRNKSLSQLGIAKSMVVRPVNQPPSMRVQQGSYIPPQYGGQGNLLAGKLPIGDGVGVDFGKPTMQVYNDRLAKYRRDRSQIL